MCLCSKINKLYSPNGLYHGRPVQVARYANPVSPQVMVKKTPRMITKYGSMN